MKESTVMILHYATGVLIILFGFFHLATHSFLWPGGYLDSLQYSSILAKYRDLFLAFTLEGLLITVAYHGFNGVRVILLEVRQGARWERAVTWTVMIVGFVMVAYGTRTLLGAQLLR